MLDLIQNTLQPVIVELLLTLILAVLAWAMRLLPEWMRVQVEQRHRDALHRALDTGVGLAFDAAKMHPSVAKLAAADRAVSEVTAYVQRSVPDALRRLAPSQDQLERMARAKIQQRIDEITGRDRLTEALNRVPGVNAQKP